MSASDKDESLTSVHRSCGFPSDDELRWLLHQGISDTALWPISGATVSFHLKHSTFDLDPAGERTLIFRAEDCDEVIDLIAWQPRTGQLASWRGQAFCLGDVDNAFNPATYFAGGALRVHESPLQWLLAEREGIVILRPDLGHAYLKGRRVLCDDPYHAARIERWCQPPRANVEILIAAPERNPA
jgi:hypothetical protein